MTIVSLSLPDQMIKEMDVLQKDRGFTGRSELIRAALRLMIEDTREKDSLVGNITGIVTVTHSKDHEAAVTKLKHEFEDIVSTHIHHRIPRGNCVEVFLLDGEGKKVASMVKALQKEEDIKGVKLTLL